jgi:hypothetical protein
MRPLPEAHFGSTIQGRLASRLNDANGQLSLDPRLRSHQTESTGLSNTSGAGDPASE